MNDWIKIEGFPKYSVNSLGQVRQDFLNHILTPQRNPYGVMYVRLMAEGYQVSRSLPLLVAKAFLTETNFIFNTPINLDGDRSNCAASNLMWRPRWFAVKYNQQFRWPYENRIERRIMEPSTRSWFKNSFVVATRFGLLESDVVLSIANRTYVWPTYQIFEVAR